jgi:lexA repressor
LIPLDYSNYLSRFLEATQAFEKYQKTTPLFQKSQKINLKLSLKMLNFYIFVLSFYQQKKREMTFSLLHFLSS